VSTAVVTIVVHSLIAYIIVRTRYAGRRLLDFVSCCLFNGAGHHPGLALLWLFLGVGILRPLYGTTAVLVIAGVIAGCPSASRSSRVAHAARRRAGGASRIAGASWWVTYRRIVLRLMTPPPAGGDDHLRGRGAEHRQTLPS